MTAPRKYPVEWRERAVRLYLESAGRPIAQVARDLGVHREALRQWVRRAEADATPRASRVLPRDVQEELTRLRKDNAQLHWANEVLKAASVFFKGELDPTRRR